VSTSASCRAAGDGTTCAAHTRAYRDGRVVEEGFEVHRVSDHLAEPGTVVWLDLVSPTDEDLQVLVRELGLHPLAVEDALHQGQRSKLDVYDDHLFLAAYAVSFDPHGELVVGELAAFVTERALVTVRGAEEFPLDALLDRWDAVEGLRGSGVAHLLHGLLDLVVDGYFQAVERLDDTLDALEDVLFDPQPRARELQRSTFQARKSLALLRRVVLPMREVVNSLLRRDLHVVDETTGPYFQDVYDHVLRVTEWTESLRDQVTSILETNLTLQGNRLNEVMRNLTAWAAILAVTTAITGFYGQNVPYPGYGETWGFVSSMLVLLGATAGLWLLLRRRGWL
jgi:magnesium transporter